MVKTPCFHFRGHRFDLWLGNKDPTCHTAQGKKPNYSFKNLILKDCLSSVCFKNPYKGYNKAVQIEMAMKK